MKRTRKTKPHGVHIQPSKNTLDVIETVSTYAVQNKVSLCAAACALIRKSVHQVAGK